MSETPLSYPQHFPCSHPISHPGGHCRSSRPWGVCTPSRAPGVGVGGAYPSDSDLWGTVQTLQTPWGVHTLQTLGGVSDLWGAVDPPDPGRVVGADPRVLRQGGG